MFALVRYKIDDTTAVVSTRYIKDLCPLHRDDFNPDFLYEVFWSGDASTKGGYYSAQIIHMAGMKTLLLTFFSSEVASFSYCARNG